MKKISYLLLAVIALFITASCNGPDPVETWDRTFKLKINYNGKEVEVKNGDSFTFDQPTGAENSYERGFHGKLTAQNQFKLIVGLERNYDATVLEYMPLDDLCIAGQCRQGQNPVYGAGGEIVSYDNLNELTFDIRTLEADVESHFTPKLSNNPYTITYTFYDNQDPENKLTFKAVYNVKQ